MDFSMVSDLNGQSLIWFSFKQAEEMQHLLKTHKRSEIIALLR